MSGFNAIRASRFLEHMNSKQILSSLTLVLAISLIALFTASGSAVAAASLTNAAQDTATGYALDIVEMNPSGLVIEVRLDNIQLTDEPADGATAHRLSVDGMTVLSPPGSFQLPSISKLIGVPASGIERITLLDLESEDVDGIHLSRVPTVQTPRTAYAQRAAAGVGGYSEARHDGNVLGNNYAEPVAIGMTGLLRDQRVAQLLIHPFDYDPVQKKLTVRWRIKAKIQFASSEAPPAHSVQASSAQDSESASHAASQAASHAASQTDRPSAYEEIYRSTLLNFAALPQPRVDQPSAATAAQVFDAHSTAPNKRLKIVVDEAGVYWISYAWIKAAGFNLDDVDPALLQMHHLGKEVAIYVHGAADGRVDINDWISFYGQTSESPFDTQNVYWLSVGNSPGRRMETRDGSVDPEIDPTEWFQRAKSWESNNVYWKDMPITPDDAPIVSQPGSQNSAAAHESTVPEQPPQESFWFWESYPSAPTVHEYTFVLSNVIQLGTTASSQAAAADVSSSAQALRGLITVHLHGRTDTPESPDHHTKIYLNDVEIADFWWDGKVRHSEEIPVLQSVFVEGENKLRVSMPGDTGAAVDSTYFDSFDVVYWAEKVAFENQLQFTGLSGAQAYGVINFSGPGIEVYNVSQPDAPIRIVDGYEWFSSGSYRIKFADEQPEPGRYVAVHSRDKLTPVDLTVVDQPRWSNPQQQADYLIITHPDFVPALEPLIAHREKSGLSVAVIDIFELYDEFSHGIHSPQAIRNFLDFAYHNWQAPAPVYVLLVGDANYDYKNFLADDYPNKVPTALFNSAVIGQTPTDNWFVSVSGDDFLPDMMIGRISASQRTEVAAAVEKILAYEAIPTDEDAAIASWIEESLFVAEDEANFQDVSDRLIEQLPYTYSPSRIYGSEFVNPGDATPRILASIDQGVSLITYIGHGSITGWFWDEQVLESTDIATLRNDLRYPFLITGSCYNGLFAHPDQRVAFAEAFVNSPKRGGIGVWSPTGLGYTYWHDKLIEALYEQLFDENQRELGAATTAAKVKAFGELGWREPVEISTLFGDPALRLHISQPAIDLVVKPISDKAVNGQSYQYAITVRNNGSESVNNLRVVTAITNGAYSWSIPTADALPPQWTIDELAPGAAYLVIVTASVADEPMPGGDPTLTPSGSLNPSVSISTQLLRADRTLESDLLTQPIESSSDPAPTPTPTPVAPETQQPDPTPIQGQPEPQETVSPEPTSQTEPEPQAEKTPTPAAQPSLLYMPFR